MVPLLSGFQVLPRSGIHFTGLFSFYQLSLLYILTDALPVFMNEIKSQLAERSLPFSPGQSVHKKEMQRIVIQKA